MTKPLLASPAASPGRGAKTCTLTGGSTLADLEAAVAAGPPIATTAARPRTATAMGGIRLRMGISSHGTCAVRPEDTEGADLFPTPVGGNRWPAQVSSAMWGHSI